MVQGVQPERIVAEATAQLPVAQSILLCLSVVLEGDQAPDILHRLPESLYAELEPRLQNLLSIPKRDRSFPLLEEVQRLSNEKKYIGVDEVDGSWILHFLKREKPAVVALVMKHLPAEKVFSIMERMDPKLRESLPSSEALERVSPEILDVVRERFEKILPELQPPFRLQGLDFLAVRNLSNAELLTLTKDLGFELVALAFQGVNERSLIELVKNLEDEDAELLFEKFTDRRGASRGDIKSAQLELLSLSLDFRSGRDLVIEAGVQRLARAMVHSDENLVLALQHKLPLKAGYQLRRYVDDFRRGQHTSTVVQKMQSLVVKRIHWLSKKDRIDPMWAKMPSASSAGI